MVGYDGETTLGVSYTIPDIDRRVVQAISVCILLVAGAMLVPMAGASAQAQTASQSDPGVTDAGAGESDIISSDGRTQRVPSGPNQTFPTNGTKVTLITGQTIAIVERGNETRYRTNASTRMDRTTTPRGTYVYPRDVDFSKFDRDLFNVDLLRQQNLTDAESPSIPVIVERRSRANDAQRAPPADALDEVTGGEGTRALASIDSTAGRMQKAQAGAASRQLVADDDVETVHLDAKVELALEDGDAAVDASAARRTHDVSGDDVTVAVIDSGVDNDHPDLRGSVVMEKNFNTDGDGGTDDDNGHGTHVAGIITGDGSASDGRHVGVAPDANIIDARVFPAEGGASVSEVIAAMEYSVENGADVLSLSLGGPTDRLRDNSPYYSAVQYAVERDVSVVAAAGNSGPMLGSVRQPGIMGGVITVGASDDAGGVASFSSRGPTPEGGYVKPDVVAPGVSVMSAEANTDGYVSRSGTSISTPFVAGTVALLRQKHPDWSERRIKNVITSTSDPLGPQSVYAQGGGEVNATAALGTDLSVDAATTDFGVIDGGQRATRVVRVHNVGDDTRDIDVSARAEAVATNDVADVALNRTSVTVEPGSSAAIELRIDASESAYGAYSGRLSVDDTHTAIFGFDSPETVRVEKTTLDGNASGDRVALVNHDTGRQYGPFVLDGGTRSFSVDADGTYTVISSGVNDGGSRPVLTANTSSVTGSTTIALDERATVERGVDASGIPHRERDLANLTVGVGATVDGTNTALEIWESDADTAAVRVSPNARVNYTLYRVLAASPGEESFDASTIYHLEHEVTDVSGPADSAVDTARLGAVHARYYRGAPTGSYGVAVGHYAPEQLTDVPTSGGIGTRHVQTIYASPGIRQYQAAWDDDGTWTATDQDGYVDVDASTNRTVTVARHPFQTRVHEWNFTADSLSWAVSPQVGQGHNPYAMADDSVGNVTLWVDGKRQFSDEGALDRTERGTTSDRPIDTARLRIEDVNDRSFHSERTVTTIAARTGGGDVNPPAVPRVTFANQSATNVVPNGTVTMNVTTSDDATLADVSAYVRESDGQRTPFEDDTGWREVPLTKADDGTYTTTLDESGYRGSLSVAVNATDAAGNYVETTAIDAVVVGSRVPVASATAEPSTAEINVTDVAFDASGTTDDAEIAEYAWDFDGDGTVDAKTDGPAIQHAYGAFGTYEPRLTVTDVHGYSNATTVEPVAVRDTTPPDARVVATDGSPDVGGSVTFDAGSSTDNNAVASYAWAADEATSLERDGSEMTATFDSAGEHDVRVTVTDANGSTDTATTAVYVGNERPSAVADGATVDGAVTVTLDASESTDHEGHALSYEWTHVGGPSASLSSATGVSTSFTAPAVERERTIELEVTVTDAFGLSDVARVPVTVRPTDDGGDTGGGGASGGGADDGGGASRGEGASDGGASSDGGGISGDGSDAGPGEPSSSPGHQSTPNVTQSRLDGPTGGSSVTVRNASDGEPVSVELPTDSTTRFTGLEITPGSDGDFAFNVTDQVQEPTGTADLKASTGHRPLGFASIDHGAVELASVTYTFTVPREELAEISAEPADVSLFRYENGEWMAKPTTVTSATDEAVTYAGTSDGFSTYAIGAEPSNGTVTVTNASLGRTDVAPGTDVTVTASVEHVGNSAAERTLALAVDGEAVASENLTLTRGETRTVTFTHVFDIAGKYAVSVDGVAAGTVTVATEATESTVSTESMRMLADDGDDPRSETDTERMTARKVAASDPVVPVAAGAATLFTLLVVLLVRRS